MSDDQTQPPGEQPPASGWAQQPPAYGQWPQQPPPPPMTPPRRSMSVGMAVGVIALAVVLVAGGVVAVVKLTSNPGATHDQAQPAGAASTAGVQPTPSRRTAFAPAPPTITPVPRPSTLQANKTPTGWENSAIHPVTAPVAVGDLIVVYTADDGQLSLRAINPTTGETVWAVPATPASLTAGQPFAVTTHGGTVFYYAPYPDAPDGDLAQGIGRLSAIDVATGSPLWTSATPLPYADAPAMCSDHKAVCVGAYTSNTGMAELRFDATTGTRTVLTMAGGRELGVGVEDPGVRNPEYIEHVDDVNGGVAWKDEVTALAGRSVTSDDGWDWDSYGDVYVGWLASTSARVGDVYTFGTDETVAVRASDGKLLWRKPGTYGCPAQGLLDDGQPLAVRCVFKGSVTFDPATGAVTTHGFDVTVEGFDVHTGATLWSRDVGDDPAIAGGSDGSVVRVDNDSFAFTDVHGRTTVVNLKTGVVPSPAAGAVGWCLQQGSWSSNDDGGSGNGSVERAAGGQVVPCTLSGAPAPAHDGTSADVGASVGGYFVWSSTDGLHGFAMATS